ncbi:prolyl aminopeptidase (secreted) [Fusarium sp. NRRL 52700]|nr:prolyl aminopeptidase (secreted) [Fusarium sp. NRRL 52700]
MHQSFLLALALHMLSSVLAAAGASNFDVSADVASTYGCGPECYQILQVANQLDRSGVFTPPGFDFDFYATAKNFSGSAPGDLLKLQPLDPKPLDIADGITAYRIQYTSIDLDGSKVPVTGFMAFPLMPVPGPKYPLVAYGHGTSGVYRGCSPSAGPALFDYHTWTEIVGRGYAVVATDYAGLGNNHTEHKYCSFPAHANDIYYSVVAARQAFRHLLSENWMSVGHSQGGGAVWKLAESKFVQSAVSKAGRYLGTVAIAPATRILDMAKEYSRELKANPEVARYVMPAELPALAIGISRVFPSYDFGLLGKALQKRLGLMKEAQLCITAMMGMTLDLDIEDVASPMGLNSTTVEKWQEEMAPGSGRSPQPMMVIQGLNDTSILPITTRNVWNGSCKNGNKLYYREYDGFDHSATVAASAPEWLEWMGAMFTGKEMVHTCDVKVRAARNKDYVKSTLEFDPAELGIGNLA